MALSDWEKAKQKYGLSKSTTQSESSWELAKRESGLSSAKAEPVSSKPTYNRSADRRVTSPSVSVPTLAMGTGANTSAPRFLPFTPNSGAATYGLEQLRGTTLSAEEEAERTEMSVENLNRQIEAAKQDVEEKGRQLTAVMRGSTNQQDRNAAKAEVDAAKDRMNALIKQRDAVASKYYQQSNEAEIQRLSGNELFQRAADVQNDLQMWNRIYTKQEKQMSPQEQNAYMQGLREKYGMETDGDVLRYLDAQWKTLGEQLKAQGVDFDRISQYLGRQEQAEIAAQRDAATEKFAQENPLLASLYSVAISPAQGIDFFTMLGTGKGSPADLQNYVPYDASVMRTSGEVSNIREGVGEKIVGSVENEKWGNVLNFLYNTGMSIADSALQTATFGAGATYLMGMSAAANQSRNIIERGGTNSQALWGGLAAGAAEAIFEKFSVENLLKPNMGEAAWKALLKQAGIEASEEAATEIANILSDAAIMGHRSEFAENVRAYQRQGYTPEQAKQKAYLDAIGQVALSSLGGLLSGGIMGGSGALLANSATRNRTSGTPNSTPNTQNAPTVEFNGAQDAFVDTEANNTTEQTSAPTEPVAAEAKAATDFPEGTGAASAGYAYRALQNDPNIPMHEAGEKPARPVNMPAVDVEGRNTSQTVRTALEAGATPDAMVPTIENLVAAGEFSYDPTTNAEVRAKAEETVANGFETAFAKWKQNIEKRASAETTALGWSLYNEAAKSGKAELAIEILGDMASYQRGNAQALQAQRILKTLSPEGQLYHMQRTVEKLAEKYAGKKGVEITLDKELAAEFLAAKTDAERNAAIEKIQQDIADQIPSTALDKFTALRYVNMLGNFKTQIRNLSSNTLMKLVGSVRYDVAAAIEALANKASGGKFEKTKSLHVGKDWTNAAKADFDGVRDVVLGESKYGDNSPMDGFARGIENKRTIFKNKVLEGYRKATNWAMEGGDILFSKSTYARALSGWLKARGFTPQQLSNGEVDAKTMDAARAYAIKEAQEATFRDNNAFSTWFSRLGRKESTPKVVKALSEGVMPFRKTPANILIRAVEYSPANLIDTLIVKPIQAKQGKVTGNDIVDSAAKSLTGTGLFLLGMALRSSGLLRGGSDEDERDINNLKGLQDYSLEIPGYGTYTFDWAAPSALTMFTGAQLQDLLDDGEITWADMADALMSLADPMLEMSMLSGVDSALSNVKYSDYSLIQLAGTMALGYITQGLTNTLVGQLERVTEPNRMTTYTDKDSALPAWLQREIGKVSAKTPIWDYQQTEYQDELGRAESSGGVAERIFENLFSPGYFEPVNKDKAANWAVDLQEELNANKVDGNVLPNANTTTSVNQTPLTQDEKERFKRVYGETYSDVIDAISGSDLFNDLTLSQKAQVGEELKQFATDKAKRDIAAERGEKYESNWDDEAALPLTSLAEVLIYGKALSSVEKEVVEAKSYSAMDALLETASSMSEDALSVMDEKPLFTRMLEAYAGANIGSEKFMNTQTAISALGQKAKFPEKADVILNSDVLNEEQKWYMLSDAKNLQSNAKDKAATAKALGIPIDIYVSSERAIADAKAEKGKDSLSEIEIRRALGKLRADARVTNVLFRIYANDDHINWQYAK